MDQIYSTCAIYDAWDDEPWTVEGAAVRVSLVCFSSLNKSMPKHLDGYPVTVIHSDLTAGEVDLTEVRRLRKNVGVSFQGPVKVGPFDVPGATAREWLGQPANATGRPNSDVVRPWINALDITRRPRDRWIIDFADMQEREAAFYARPFSHVVLNVKPLRDRNRRPRRRQFWWQHGETVPGLRAAVAQLRRFIATPRVAKHRLFVWCMASTLPDSRVYAIARDDDVAFGILHSRFHEAWSLAIGSRHGDGSEGGRPTYNNKTCFETFPFPAGLTLDRPASAHEGDQRATAIAIAARKLTTARDSWLNPPELISEIPEVLPDLPARKVPKNAKAAALLKSCTLTNLYNTRGTPEGAWLDILHHDLDATVAAAYGWPLDISDDEAVVELFAMNQHRADLTEPLALEAADDDNEDEDESEPATD